MKEEKFVQKEEINQEEINPLSWEMLRRLEEKGYVIGVEEENSPARCGAENGAERCGGHSALIINGARYCFGHASELIRVLDREGGPPGMETQKTDRPN